MTFTHAHVDPHFLPNPSHFDNAQSLLVQNLESLLRFAYQDLVHHLMHEWFYHANNDIPLTLCASQNITIKRNHLTSHHKLCCVYMWVLNVRNGTWSIASSWGCTLTWAKEMLVSLKNFGKGGGAEVERASRKIVLFMVDMDNDKRDKDYVCG